MKTLKIAMILYICEHSFRFFVIPSSWIICTLTNRTFSQYDPFMVNYSLLSLYVYAHCMKANMYLKNTENFRFIFELLQVVGLANFTHCKRKAIYFL